MRMSMNWLKEYVNLDGVTPEVLAEKLTIAGLEVEGIEKMAEGTKMCIRDRAGPGLTAVICRKC